MIRKTTLVHLVALVICSGIRAECATPEDTYKGWPEGWVSAYKRFERFIVERKKTFPATDLAITPTGNIYHSVRLFKGSREHLTTEVYCQGNQTLGVIISEESSRLEINAAFTPGLHTVVLRSCGFLGYQYLYPFLWLEMTEEENPNLEKGNFRFRWKAIDSPEPPEDFWPNERMFLFKDFAVFAGKNPFDLYEKNVKVDPAITLGLTDAGVLVRDALPMEIEQLLVWRIYHNGRLVDKSPAKEVLRHPADHGQGTYQAFLCVEGPTGPMPVSNLVEFPLFEEYGKRVVFPGTVQRIGFPDILLDVLTPSQVDQLYAEMPSRERRTKRRYNEASFMAGHYTYPYPTDPRKAQTLLLWQAWHSSLNDFLERESSTNSNPSWLWMIHRRN